MWHCSSATQSRIKTTLPVAVKISDVQQWPKNEFQVLLVLPHNIVEEKPECLHSNEVEHIYFRLVRENTRVNKIMHKIVIAGINMGVPCQL